MQFPPLKKHRYRHYKEMSHNVVWAIITLEGNTMTQVNRNSCLDNRTLLVHYQSQGV